MVGYAAADLVFDTLDDFLEYPVIRLADVGIDHGDPVFHRCPCRQGDDQCSEEQQHDAQRHRCPHLHAGEGVGWAEAGGFSFVMGNGSEHVLRKYPGVGYQSVWCNSKRHSRGASGRSLGIRPGTGDGSRASASNRLSTLKTKFQALPCVWLRSVRSTVW